MVGIATFSLLLLAGLSAAEESSGTPVSIEEYPSIVQIEFGYGPVWFQYCVGSVLTSRHVLTVAHCLYGPLFDASRRRVRAGAGERGRDGEIIYVRTVHNHPSFTDNGFDADISIAELATSLTFGSTIQQGPIVASGTTFPANVPVTVVGWGRTTEDAIWADRNLNSIGLHTVDSDLCVSLYASLPIPITISENMICSGVPGEDGRNLGIRDGGSPIFYDGVIVGLVALGSPVGEKYPLVATAVSSYTDWIVATAA